MPIFISGYDARTEICLAVVHQITMFIDIRMAIFSMGDKDNPVPYHIGIGFIFCGTQFNPEFSC
jgi:hypothetical protein